MYIGYYFQHYPLTWISVKRNLSQPASFSVARHNGSYTGGPFDFSTLLISVRTYVPSGKRNDFLKASGFRPLSIEEQPEDEDKRAAFPESQPNSH
jgi:hypothetical protein